MDTQLKIDEQLKNLVPPLTEEEYGQLERNIVSLNQCMDAVTAWDGYIIDGHCRYEICVKHGIPFRVREARFSRRWAAILWIINNQLGRRNLTDAMRIELASQTLEALRRQAKDNRKQGGRGGPISEPVDMRKAVASAAGVGEQKVRQYMKIRSLAGPGLLERVQSGEMKIGTAYNLMRVESTKVEELLTEADAAETDRPLYEKAVFGNIAAVAGLYRMMSENLPEGAYGEPDDEIDAMLKMQRKIIRNALAKQAERQRTNVSANERSERNGGV